MNLNIIVVSDEADYRIQSARKLEEADVVLKLNGFLLKDKWGLLSNIPQKKLPNLASQLWKIQPKKELEAACWRDVVATERASRAYSEGQQAAQEVAGINVSNHLSAVIENAMQEVTDTLKIWEVRVSPEVWGHASPFIDLYVKDESLKGYMCEVDFVTLSEETAQQLRLKDANVHVVFKNLTDNEVKFINRYVAKGTERKFVLNKRNLWDEVA